MENFIQNVVYYTETHKTLHGKVGFDAESVAKDLQMSFGYDYKESLETVNKYINNEIQYGVFIGRCQPFHLGHQAVINEIMLSGRIPIIVLGSIDKHDEKNPLSYEQRKEIINTVFCSKDVIITGLEDQDNWDDWMNNIQDVLFQKDRTKENVTLFYHNKEVDRQDFEYKGEKYKQGFYTDMFDIEGIQRREIEFVDRKDFKIDSNGRDIRHNIEGFKHFLDARVYWKLRNKHNWKV